MTIVARWSHHALWTVLRLWTWVVGGWSWCRRLTGRALRWVFRGRILSVAHVDGYLAGSGAPAPSPMWLGRSWVGAAAASREGPWVLRYCDDAGFHTALVHTLPTPLIVPLLPSATTPTIPLLAAEWDGVDVTTPLRRVASSFTPDSGLRLGHLRRYFLSRGVLTKGAGTGPGPLMLIRDDTLETLTYDTLDAPLILTLPAAAAPPTPAA